MGQGLDSFILIYIAFGVGSDWKASALLSAALAQWITKTVYETVATPLTYAVVGYMKRTEEMDVTDVPRSLNPLGIFAWAARIQRLALPGSVASGPPGGCCQTRTSAWTER